MASDYENIADNILPMGATGTYTFPTKNGKGTISIAIGEDEFALANNNEATTIDDDLGLAGLLDSEKTRFKENLLNKSLSDFDAQLSVPNAPATSPLLSQMKAGNDLKQKAHERAIMLAKVEVEYKKTDIQIKLKNIKLQEDANALQQAKIQMQGQLYLQNERIIKQNATLIKNMANIKSVISQNSTKPITLTTTEGDALSGFIDSFNSMKESQISTNTKIVENIDKKNEHLDFQKDGISTLKDSSGNVIKPREVQAKNNAEHNIYKTAENTYNWKDSTEETLNHLDDSLNGSSAGEGGIGLDEASLFKLLDKFLLHNKDVYATENTSKIFKKENT